MRRELVLNYARSSGTHTSHKMRPHCKLPHIKVNNYNIYLYVV